MISIENGDIYCSTNLADYLKKPELKVRCNCGEVYDLVNSSSKTVASNERVIKIEINCCCGGKL